MNEWSSRFYLDLQQKITFGLSANCTVYLGQILGGTIPIGVPPSKILGGRVPPSPRCLRPGNF